MIGPALAALYGGPALAGGGGGGAIGLGGLDPARYALAGLLVSDGLEQVALSDGAETVAWRGEYRAHAARMPSKGAPKPAAALDPASLLGGASRGEIDGPPVHRGDAQELEIRAWDPPPLQGRVTAVALSADGRWIAVGTDREAAVFSVGDPEPAWRWDLGQGGTAGLAFAGGELLVLGRDGTVLAVRSP